MANFVLPWSKRGLRVMLNIVQAELFTFSSSDETCQYELKRCIAAYSFVNEVQTRTRRLSQQFSCPGGRSMNHFYPFLPDWPNTSGMNIDESCIYIYIYNKLKTRYVLVH